MLISEIFLLNTLDPRVLVKADAKKANENCLSSTQQMMRYLSELFHHMRKVLLDHLI